MVDTFFPITPVDTVPKPAGNYKGKAIEDWTWKDFQNYFDDSYAQKFNSRPPSYSLKVRPNQIKNSLNLRGNVLFKAMIDWLISHPHYSSQWYTISLNLCLGNHNWAIEISQKANKKLGTELDLTEEEL